MTTLAWPDARSRLRGLVVGYCLGDALGRAREPYTAPLVAGTPSMLFLASVEGVVRALVREQLTGHSTGLADCCWHATARWAHRARRDTLRGVVDRRVAAEPHAWPDGWLAGLALLRGGRGSAPAIEASLDLGADLDPRPGRSGSDSVGDLVLSRTLPVALLAAVPATARPQQDGPATGENLGHPVSRDARDVAAYSHGIPAQVIAVAMTRTMAEVLTTGRVHPLVDLADLSAVYRGVPRADEVVMTRVALRGVAEHLPPQSRTTAEVMHGIPSGPRSVLRAATDGLRWALTHPGRHQVDDAISEAIRTPLPAASALMLALLGAAHGIEALPQDAVARLDVGHVADQLVGDLVTQVDASPLTRPDDEAGRAWLRRYPAT